MTIGVAIPCVEKHIIHLTNLFDSIEAQTVKPDQVIVSCSSVSEPVKIAKTYSFPLKIISNAEPKNSSQNRNIAASHLSTDYVSFFDADDIMYPQRIEFITRVIDTYHSDIIIHNFDVKKPEVTPLYDELLLLTDSLVASHTGCLAHKKIPENIYGIHHGQVTVVRSIWESMKFPEDKEYIGKEDSIFCSRIVATPSIKNCYILQPLSFYKPSGTCLT